MYRHSHQSDVHAWMCTAYHEAGHAVAALLLGRDLYLVEVTDRWEGLTWHEGRSGHIAELVELANEEGRVRMGLLRFWLDEFWIADAGVIAEEEFNLVPPDVLARGGQNDAMSKYDLIEDFDEEAFITAYYYRQVEPWMTRITKACRTFFRLPNVAALTRTLAEALLRSRRLHGEEVIDAVLSNRAAVTGQRDLFWEPEGDDLFVRKMIPHVPQQYRLL